MAMSRHAGPTPVSAARSSSSLSTGYLSSASFTGLDQSARSSTETASSAGQPNTYSVPPTRTFAPPPTHPAMGQVSSRGEPSSPAAKLKRGLLGRRKKSEDGATLFANMQQRFGSKAKERERSDSAGSTPVLATPGVSYSTPPTPTQPQRAGKAAKQFGMQLASSTKQVFSGIKPHNVVNLVTTGGSRPPPPPKPAALQAAKRTADRLSLPPPPDATLVPSTPALPSLSIAQSARGADVTKKEHHSSLMPHSPSMDSAIQFMRQSDETEAGQAKEHVKAEWRKSDSTTMSHATARPGAAAGARTSRPVSMADSVNSTSTVMPANRRLSALVTDSDFPLLEEEPARLEEQMPRSAPVQDAPTSLMSKAHNRRSQSLSLGPSWGAKLKAVGLESASTDQLGYSVETPPRETPPGMLSLSTHTPTVSMAAATGFISPSSTSGSSTTAGNIKGRLAAWTTAAAASSNAHLWRKNNSKSPPPAPPLHPTRLAPTASRETPPATRQPAISITGGLSPAAGFAAALGKKVGRAWGDRSGSPSSGSPSSAPSSYPGDDPLGRAHPNGSGSGLAAGLANLGKGKGRRTPNAPSGAWSVASSSASSASDPDNWSTAASTGPMLGKPLRVPRRGGNHASLVFGCQLATCVAQTRAVSISERRTQKMPDNLDFEVLGPQVFEHRLLPALVQRCAEHLIKWGVGGEEEGLFRISGRSTHVNRLRTEFDNGADYDLAQCTPADLDPHAVASIFKAYLRELPEPILTNELNAYFEAALTAEAEEDSKIDRTGKLGVRGQGLPSGPRAGGQMPLRKPPSLSTLAAPSFAGLRPSSKTLLDALAVLVARLPRENRDLLRTVTDIMKETAKKSRVTKMPLSNLLLVFCPSLHMSPNLVRVLCEADGVWAGAPQGVPDPVVVDIKSHPVVLDIKQDELSAVFNISPQSSTTSSSADEDVSVRISREPTMASDDDASALSASDASIPSSSGTHPSLSLHALTTSSSSESLGPSTPSESPSPMTFTDSGNGKDAHGAPSRMPRVASPSEGIAFPTTAPAVSPISSRKSFPSLSLPSLSLAAEVPARTASSPSPSPRAVRMKRPSLTLLFSGKRSPSPGIVSISSPQLISSSNPLVPTPSVHPTEQVSRLPPLLTTPISSSPIDFGESFADGAPSGSDKQHLAVPLYAAPWPAGAPGDYFRSASSSTGDSGRSYASAKTSTSDTHEARPRPRSTARSASSSHPSLNLRFSGGREEAPEEWTRSVLLAADIPSDSPPPVSVKDVIKVFEQREA